jgi:hypothetical protein
MRIRWASTSTHLGMQRKSFSACQVLAVMSCSTAHILVPHYVPTVGGERKAREILVNDFYWEALERYVHEIERESSSSYWFFKRHR